MVSWHIKHLNSLRKIFSRFLYTVIAQADNAAISDDKLVQILPMLDELRADVIAGQELTVEGCSNRESEIRKVLQNRIDSRHASLGLLGARVASAMRDYANRYPKETRDADASVEAAGEFRAMLASLRDEGLPRFEACFKSLLNENAIREVAGFQSKLREEERTIRDRIETINGSLHAIDYHDGTYIAVQSSGSWCPVGARIRVVQLRPPSDFCTSTMNRSRPHSGQFISNGALAAVELAERLRLLRCLHHGFLSCRLSARAENTSASRRIVSGGGSGTRRL